jgi:hypothetical protein
MPMATTSSHLVSHLERLKHQVVVQAVETETPMQLLQSRQLVYKAQVQVLKNQLRKRHTVGASLDAGGFLKNIE